DEDDSLTNEIVVVDDIVVDLPHGTLPDVLITAAQEVEGVFVDSIRPFSGSIDRRGHVQMLASIAARRSRRAEALETLMADMERGRSAISVSGASARRSRRAEALETVMADLPRSMSAGWAVLVAPAACSPRPSSPRAAPEDNGQELDSAPVLEARVLNPEQEDWIPEPWAVMDSSLAATPIEGSSLILIVGRPGGPDFLLSEVEHLRQLGSILGAFFA